MTHQLENTAEPGKIRLSSNVDRLRFIYYLTVIHLQNEIRNYSLGFFWWFIDPLVNTAIFYVLTTVIMHVRDENVALYLLIGLLVFRFLQSAITGGAGSLRPAFRLSQRIYLPKYVFVVSDVLAEAFKFLVGTAVVIALLLLLGRGDISLPHLALVTVVAFLFSLGCASIVSVFVSLITDLQIVIQYGFRLLFFISGTFFMLDQVPEQWRTVFLLNPFALLIHEYRSALLLPDAPNYGLLAVLTVVSLALLAIGQWILVRFDRVLPKYVVI
jgi:ABC-type polysaccharide/polyol phosphate export permease